MGFCHPMALTHHYRFWIPLWDNRFRSSLMVPFASTNAVWVSVSSALSTFMASCWLDGAPPLISCSFLFLFFEPASMAALRPLSSKMQSIRSEQRSLLETPREALRASATSLVVELMEFWLTRTLSRWAESACLRNLSHSSLPRVLQSYMNRMTHSSWDLLWEATDAPWKWVFRFCLVMVDSPQSHAFSRRRPGSRSLSARYGGQAVGTSCLFLRT